MGSLTAYSGLATTVVSLSSQNRNSWHRSAPHNLTTKIGLLGELNARSTAELPLADEKVRDKGFVTVHRKGTTVNTGSSLRLPYLKSAGLNDGKGVIGA